ncbi:hypothetical protein H257_05131 [Aphanomyces astaci]|uniref:Uncharacterized protein n=1 Tax=Aphanomyces astaci TaxID=112090 RepID=W4GUE1_APHAT|nr:hypothetical protein H257_05131 [Aphanomyces astaci]ETV82528.1 hypothetical protein H257_05131 [Aphanomyces astaci]|eukprot:XP_009828197.1 hypothetical protein H257_05131 [Aphanomyces astaci]
MYRLHQLVRVQPEHFPQRNLPSFAYGQVTRATATHVHVYIRANNVLTSSFREAVPIDSCVLPIVDIDELEAGTGLWMRRFAFGEVNGSWHHGQPLRPTLSPPTLWSQHFQSALFYSVPKLFPLL